MYPERPASLTDTDYFAVAPPVDFTIRPQFHNRLQNRFTQSPYDV
jgi:hypothetical protein